MGKRGRKREGGRGGEKRRRKRTKKEEEGEEVRTVGVKTARQKNEVK
jgi:hypothetical protein